MIKEITMYACQCDGCGKDWEFDGAIAYITKEQLDDAVDWADDWKVIEGKHYCQDCWEYDETTLDPVPKTKEVQS